MVTIKDFVEGGMETAKVLHTYLTTVYGGSKALKKMTLVDAAKEVVERAKMADTRQEIISSLEEENAELHEALDHALGLDVYPDEEPDTILTLLYSSEPEERVWEVEDLDEEAAVEINQVINTLYPYLETQGIQDVDNLTWTEAAAKTVELAKEWETAAWQSLNDMAVLVEIVEALACDN